MWQFRYPKAIAVDNDGDIFVADTYNDRIQSFTGDGIFLTMWDNTAGGQEQLFAPQDVAVDGDGNVYVADLGRIQMFTATERY